MSLTCVSTSFLNKLYLGTLERVSNLCVNKVSLMIYLGTVERVSNLCKHKFP